MKKIIQFIISLAICHGAGALGAFFTTSQIQTWYAALERPFFTPPSWLFGPVWLTLYTLMAVAIYLVWQKGLSNEKTRFAFTFFIAHLVLNATWSIVFFGMNNILLALINIIVLYVMIVYLMKLFWQIDKRATYLFIPYILWVTLATALNIGFFILN